MSILWHFWFIISLGFQQIRAIHTTCWFAAHLSMNGYHYVALVVHCAAGSWETYFPFTDKCFIVISRWLTLLHLCVLARSLQYNDLSNRVIGLTKDDVPSDLKKKVTLLVYFSQYMDEHLIYGADVDPNKRQTMAAGVFMKKWFRTDRAIVMHLSNGTLQVQSSLLIADFPFFLRLLLKT